MYDVNIDRIGKQLNIIDDCIAVLGEVASRTGQTGLVNRFARERALHISVEAVTDIGNALIDGFIMRDPGSYTDIVDILEDEGVLPKDVIQPLMQIVTYRKKLVYHYAETDEAEMGLVASEAASCLPQLRPHVEHYLTKELGPWQKK